MIGGDVTVIGGGISVAVMVTCWGAVGFRVMVRTLVTVCV